MGRVREAVYTEAVKDHATNPRGVGPPTSHTHRGLTFPFINKLRAPVVWLAPGWR